MSPFPSLSESGSGGLRAKLPCTTILRFWRKNSRHHNLEYDAEMELCVLPFKATH